MAGGYGVVDNNLWGHHVFKSLSDDAKLMFLYLKTCEHNNMIGCFHLPLGYVMADLKWKEAKALQSLTELYSKGFCKYDETIEIALLPKHLIKHPLQNNNQVIGAEKIIKELPSEFKYLSEIIDIYNNQEKVIEALQKPLESLANTETETETETETGKTPSLEEVKKYFIDNGYTEASAEKAFNYYNEPMIESGGRVWKDSKGNTVKVWKQKMRGVWFKPENEIPKGQKVEGKNW